MSTILLLMAVVIISIGQILQKLAALEVELGNGLRAAVVSLLQSPNFWRASVAMVLGLIVWLLALTEVEVSKAYPILALSFGLTTILSVMLLEEQVSKTRWLGVGLISLGAAIVVAG